CWATAGSAKRTSANPNSSLGIDLSSECGITHRINNSVACAVSGFLQGGVACPKLRHFSQDHPPEDQSRPEPLTRGEPLPQPHPRRHRREDRLETEDQRRPRRRHVSLRVHLPDQRQCGGTNAREDEG